MPPTARKRARTTRRTTNRQQQAHSPLQLAQRQLADAIHALIQPRPHHHEGRTAWLNSRYTELKQAITNERAARGHTQPSSRVPMWIDALMLAMTIDTRTAQWDTNPDTPTRLHQIQQRTWRPQDTQHLQTITTEITIWNKTIDDLFAVKPVYLHDPYNPHKWATCPRCGQSETRRNNDEGQRIRVPALMINAEHTAICNSCHDQWPADQLLFLARVLGYRKPAGMTDHEIGA